MLPQPDEIRHNNPAYPLLDESEQRGGYRAVTDVAGRDAIPILKRKHLAVVSYMEDGGAVTKRYKSADLSDTEWVKEDNWEAIGGGLASNSFAQTLLIETQGDDHSADIELSFPLKDGAANIGIWPAFKVKVARGDFDDLDITSYAEIIIADSVSVLVNYGLQVMNALTFDTDHYTATLRVPLNGVGGQGNGDYYHFSVELFDPAEVVDLSSASISLMSTSEDYPSETAPAYLTKSDVLTKTNTTLYTPSADYHPATLKTVNDAVAEVFQALTDAVSQTIDVTQGKNALCNVELLGDPTFLLSNLTEPCFGVIDIDVQATTQRAVTVIAEDDQGNAIANKTGKGATILTIAGASISIGWKFNGSWLDVNVLDYK